MVVWTSKVFLNTTSEIVVSRCESSNLLSMFLLEDAGKVNKLRVTSKYTSVRKSFGLNVNLQIKQLLFTLLARTVMQSSDAKMQFFRSLVDEYQ